MKRLFMLLCAVVAFAACEQAPIEEAQGVVMSDRSLEVSFEGADDTRIQLQNGKTVWTEGDHVSVFYRSTVNEEWQFDGKTGDRIGNIVPVDNTLNPPATHNRVVVIYPYNNEYYLNTETYSIEASLPAVQNYLEDSYGTNGNIMVSSGDYKQVSLKSVCGWLKLQLTGDGEVVKSITLRGNNGEQVAGELYINTSDATCVLASASGDAGESEVGGTLVRPGTILTEVTLDCGEGVALGKEATAFYIALPPQTFEKGFTVEIECDGYKPMTLSTTNTLTIERNHIQPMASVEHNATPIVPNNQIWYTSSDGNVVTPNNTNVFGANIVSNTYTNGKGVITFDGDVTSIGDNAFQSCESLTSVNIPDRVTTIEGYAFYSCNSLTSVNIPDSVTTIGDVAFGGCTSLENVYCYATTPPSLGYDPFYDNASGRRIYVYEECVELYKSAWSDYKDSIYTNGENCPETTTIQYTTNDGNTITSSKLPIISNSYDNGVGTMVISGIITVIPNSTFRSCTSLTSVNIPDSVTEIGDYAFYSCDSLTSVTIGNGVTSIGDDAFAYCRSLTSVNIPDSVTTIGEFAFLSCDSLTGFTGKFAEDNGRILVVDGVLTAFAPAGITEYNIPDSISTIGDLAFFNCDSLTSVNIPDSVTTIGYYAFSVCYSLTEFTGKFAEDNGRILVVDGVLTAFAPAGITEYNIPDSVTTIGHGAFWGCNSLTSVKIPDSVTEIEIQAFAYCYSLTSVTIGDSVTTIGDNAFQSCESLTSVNIPDSVATIGNEAFKECFSLTSVNIPDSVTTIGDVAFGGCTSLENVYCYATTPPSLGYDAFNDNASGRRIYVYEECVEPYKSAWSDYKDSIYTNGQNCPDTTTIEYTTNDGNIITSSKLPIFSNIYENGVGTMVVAGKITLIPNHAFYDCFSLTSVNIPDSVTTIGGGAFEYCNALTSVNIPDSVTEIGSRAFYSCYSLTSVYCKATTPPALGDNNVFDDNGIGRKIYVPTESVEAYRSDEEWWYYASAIVGYDFEKDEIVEMQPNNEIWYTSYDGNIVETNNTNVFGANIVSNTCTYGMGVITFDGDVTSIGNAAFSECERLTSVNIPDSVTTIGNEAFKECTSLTSVNIPDSVTSIGEGAFRYCYSLTSVNIGDSVTTIGNWAFEGCTSLTSVTIGDGVTTIGEHAFISCISLTSVNIPDSVTTIGVGAFIGCDSLTSVTIGNGVTSIGDDAFAYCRSLTSVNIPDSVTTIGYSAFCECTSLTSVNIPDSVTTIGGGAFIGCESLTSVYCKATTPPALGWNVFDYNGSGRKIYVPTESVEAYRSAEEWWYYADVIVGYDFENGVVVE